jgi:hypothetical protein
MKDDDDTYQSGFHIQMATSAKTRIMTKALTLARLFFLRVVRRGERDGERRDDEVVFFRVVDAGLRRRWVMIFCYPEECTKTSLTLRRMDKTKK